MIDTSRFFSEFKEPISSAMLNGCLILVSDRDKYNWKPYYNFDAVQVSDVIVSKDSLLCKLKEGHKFEVGIIEMKPHHFYAWHVDTDRACGINIPLDGDDSKCLFRDKEEVNGPVFELYYRFKTAYLFNTTKEHCVYNGKGYRRMISVRFLGDETYNALKEEFKDILV
tara:strand:+ start:27 stop:530 length:504 start_codon:yes stop_codon:yes gene_type:complete